MKIPNTIIAVASIIAIAAITAPSALAGNTITPSERKALKDARDAAAKDVQDNVPETDPGGRIRIAEDAYELAIVNFLKARAAYKKLLKDKTASKGDKAAAKAEFEDLKDLAESATPDQSGMTETQCGEAADYRKALRALRKAQRAYDLGLGKTLVYPPGDPNDPAYGGPEETNPLSASETGTDSGIFSFFGGRSVANQSAHNAAALAVRGSRPTHPRPNHVRRCQN